MKRMLYKEFKLAASPLSFFFIAAAFLTFVPGYPILLGAFFTTLGIFYSFQTMRENGDLKYSLMLPVSKADTVKGKFAFTLIIEAVSFAVMTVITLVRMAFFSTAAVYTSNALMGANLPFLGFALIVFGLFNLVFLGGFFKTGYYFGKPFITYCILSFLVIFSAESLWHFPNMSTLNSLGFEHIALQLALLLAGAAAGAAFTVIGIKKSIRAFNKTDL